MDYGEFGFPVKDYDGFCFSAFLLLYLSAENEFDMLGKTRGVVLRCLPYNDRYSIVHVYTESFGRVSYLFSRDRGKKTLLSKVLSMPFAVIDMEVVHLSNRDIHKVKECRLSFPESDVFFNPLKSSLALFLSEILYRIVKDTEPDRGMFDFLYKSVQMLEYSDAGIANFHLVFLLQLLHYMGIFPNLENGCNSYFDMQEGIFTSTIPLHKYYLGKEESQVFSRLLRMSYENMALYSFSRHDRVQIINRILEYYRLHLPEFPEIKSLSVLQALFE